MRNGAAISATTFGTGLGGDARVEASDTLLSGDGSELFTGIAAVAGSGNTGAAGDVMVKADTLSVRDGAEISAATFGSGRGGNLAITAEEMELSDGGSINALSESSSTSAVSGNIFIQTQDSLQIIKDSEISVATSISNAGNINIQVGNLLHLQDGSAITTSVAGGEGSGGNINIDPVFTVLDDNSRIIAQAKKGSGGNINITADFLFQSPDSLIDASSEFGQSGTVTINSPDTNITGSIMVLPETFFDAAALMRQHCAARTAGGRSSLVVRGGGAVLVEPGLSYIPAFYLDADGGNSAQSGAGSEENGGFFHGLSKATASSFQGLAFGCNPI